MFCGKVADSEEHIIGKWLLRDLGLYNFKSRIGFGRQRADGSMDEIDAPQPLGGFRTKEVCRDCNNGWMSGLETYVKPRLAGLFDDPVSLNHRLMFQGLFVPAPFIARWLLKTACTFGAKMSIPVPSSLRQRLYAGLLHPELSVDLSINEQCGAYIGISREWNVYDGQSLAVKSVAGESFRFVWQVRHLAMRVSYFPGCEMNMTKPRFPVRVYPRFCVAPDWKDGSTTRQSYRYESLEQLEHETFYFIDGNPENPWLRDFRQTF